jgi:hypothetical protein
LSRSGRRRPAGRLVPRCANARFVPAREAPVPHRSERQSPDNHPRRRDATAALGTWAGHLSHLRIDYVCPRGRHIRGSSGARRLRDFPNAWLQSNQSSPPAPPTIQKSLGAPGSSRRPTGSSQRPKSSSLRARSGSVTSSSMSHRAGPHRLLRGAWAGRSRGATATSRGSHARPRRAAGSHARPVIFAGRTSRARRSMSSGHGAGTRGERRGQLAAQARPPQGGLLGAESCSNER